MDPCFQEAFEFVSMLRPVRPVAPVFVAGQTAGSADPPVGEATDSIYDAVSEDKTAAADNAEDDLSCGVCSEQDEPLVKKPTALPEVKAPSAKEFAEHCLTHLPYRRWCPYCVAAEMPNVAHRSLPAFSKRFPYLFLTTAS